LNKYSHTVYAICLRKIQGSTASMLLDFSKNSNRNHTCL